MTNSNSLTDRAFWAHYWCNYRPRPVAPVLHYDKYLLQVPEGSRFIEIGGFPGEHALRFRKMRQCEVSLLDFYIDPEIVHALEQVNGVECGTIHTIESDFFTAYPDTLFDVVFSDGFIEHFEDTAAVVARHTDLLTPGGTLLLIVPNLLGINGWVQKWFDPANLAIHNLGCMKPRFLRFLLADLPLTGCEVVYSGKPMVWLEKRPGRVAALKRVLVKMLSMAIKIFPRNNRFFSPYIIVSAKKKGSVATLRSMNTPLISVITVVYNAASLMQRTIESVVSQDYAHLEYIIVDGASTDGTREMIASYGSSVSQWVSEPDKGIYDAMNKGLAMARGHYVWFLNAGDTLPDPHTVTALVATLPSDELPSVMYGETLICDGEGRIVGPRRKRAPEKLTWRSFRQGMVVCHQAILVERKLAAPYNLNYRISADFAWVLSALKKSHSVHNSKMVLAHYMQEGLSRRNILLSLRERAGIMAGYYGWPSVVWNHLLMIPRFLAFRLRFGRF